MTRTIRPARILLLGLLVSLILQMGQAQEKKGTRPRVLPRVTPDLLEGVLNALDLSFKKDEEKDRVHAYLFQRGDTKIKLVNYDGGDLWIEAVFDKKFTLDQVNQWNADARYTRCVLLENDAKSSVSLEMQLDCLNGVTEGMVRQFLIRFGGELKEFQKFGAK